MSPHSHLLRAICLSGIGIIAGCATHSASDSDKTNRTAAGQYYDQYYGQPPQPAQATRSAQQQAPATQGSSADRKSGMVVNPAAPKTYVVKKGDTMWGIARKYLHTPAYWPEIWDKNQRIANPHQIYPGDILHFGYQKNVAGGAEKLVPRIRIERKGYGQPLSTLAPFLDWPRVLDDNSIKNAPYILASRDDHTLITRGERVYIRNLKKPMAGERYAVYHPQKPLYDPDTKALLGHQVDYVGYAKIDRADQLSSATILNAKDAIRKGDRLYPPIDHTQALRAPIQMPAHKVRGEIISLYHAKYLSSDCMVIVINKGRQDNIKPGHTLGIYSDGQLVTDINRTRLDTKLLQQKQRTQLPPEKVAEAIIYSVSDKLSYGLIVNTEREVKNGDKIGNP
jgi:LysM repeat protein